MRYSSGMYVRLAFARAAHWEPEILLVDEVLAVGDAGFQKKCLGKMGDVAKEGRTAWFGVVPHPQFRSESGNPRSVVISHGGYDTINRRGGDDDGHSNHFHERP